MMIFHIVGGSVWWWVLTGYIVHTAHNMIQTVNTAESSRVPGNTGTHRNIPNLSLKFRRSDGGKGSGCDGGEYYNVSPVQL